MVISPVLPRIILLLGSSCSCSSSLMLFHLSSILAHRDILKTVVVNVMPSAVMDHARLLNFIYKCYNINLKRAPAASCNLLFASCHNIMTTDFLA